MEESGILESSKQEAFAQAVVRGINQTDAYKETHDTSNMKIESIWVAASRLASDDKVSLRIRQLKEELAAKCLWSLEDSVNTLKNVIIEPDKKADVVNAVKELNSMYGYKAAVKQEITGKDGAPLNPPELIIEISGKPQ